MMAKRVYRVPFLLGTVASFSLVAGGVAFSELMRLAACPLCIWQRIFYLLFGLMALAGYAGCGSRLIRRGSAFLMLVAAVAGGTVAGYQVWIQRFAPMTTCAGKETWWEAIVRVLGEQVPVLFKASGLCSDPAWTFLDLSIADWSLLMFTGLAGLALYCLRRKA